MMHPKPGLARLALLCASLLCAAPAVAADTPSSRLLPPAPALPDIYSWTGIYLGVQAGYSWGQERTAFSDALGRAFNGAAFRQSSDSALGGAHAGFNLQTGSIVLGIEGDVEALDAGETLVAPAMTGRVKRDWQASVRGRVGFAMDRFMIYATGGAAFTDFDYHLYDAAAGLSASTDRSKTGWTAGAGVNFAYTDNLILGAEYRYTDFGKVNAAGSGPLLGLTVRHEPTTHTLRASLAYKF
ncbi:MAG TPA: outer membrane protein [Bosea sp. (in: a-proteobacteria)]|jgi:outer membrane immunogenic protein|uniref:outer membrane protein n=1 Tax=Bosea sp. (in: a-proteobacteria) TaxID=1871050 RepID=UPI002E15F9B8|nr:outer membrane protein [Bosea sp. (in: a-proteobacteria)]